MNKQTRQLTAITMATFMFLATACQTVQGVGKDVEKVGEKTEEILDN